MLIRPDARVLDRESGPAFDEWIASAVGRAVVAAPHEWTLHRIARGALVTHLELASPLSEVWLATRGDEVVAIDWDRRAPKAAPKQNLAISVIADLHFTIEALRSATGIVLVRARRDAATRRSARATSLLDHVMRRFLEVDALRTEVAALYEAHVPEVPPSEPYYPPETPESLEAARQARRQRLEDFRRNENFPSGRQVDLPAEILAISPREQSYCDWCTRSSRGFALCGVKTTTITVDSWTRIPERVGYWLRFDEGWGLAGPSHLEQRPDVEIEALHARGIPSSDRETLDQLRTRWRHARQAALRDLRQLDASDGAGEHAKLRAFVASFAETAARNGYEAADELEAVTAKAW